jgi:hypothetical protein
LYRKRSVHIGTRLLADLKCREFGGRYKKFAVMAPADFELLVNLVGPKIVKRVIRFVAPVPVQEGLAVTYRFLTAGDSYTRLQYILQISKETVRLYLKSIKLLLMH